MSEDLQKQWNLRKSCKTLTVSMAFSFIVEQYSLEVQKSRAPKHTDFLLKLMHKLVSWSTFTLAQQKQLKTQIDRKILNVGSSIML